jgi:hypothetical protein
VSRLPQLEAQLVAAAGRRRPRVRRPLLLAAGALAVAACALAALLLATASKPQRRERPVAVPETVPAATLVRARELAKTPVPKEAKIPAGRIVAEARRMMAQMPYPPGMSDRFDWRRNAWKFKTVLELRGSVEYHAYCTWVTYWVRGADRPGATAVLAETPYWPLLRRPGDHRPTYWHNKIATAAREGDMAVMRQEALANCS